MKHLSKYFQFLALSGALISALSSCKSDNNLTDSQKDLDPNSSETISSSAIDPGVSSIPSDISSAGNTSVSSSTNLSSIATSSSSAGGQTSVDLSNKLANITKACANPLPALDASAKKGWGSRYWDCCKPSCAWPEKFGYDPDKTVKTCDINDNEIATQTETGNIYYPYEGVKNACDGGTAFSCYDQAPFAVCEGLAYGYAAASGKTLGDAACGSCFLLEFDGGMHNYDPKYEHAALKGKKMIVMVTNIGYDVEEGQFDIMIPGGGMGAYTGGCAAQWGVDLNNKDLVGETFGGFRSTCEKKLGYYPEPTLEANQKCVRDMCDALFNKPGLEDMLQGCYWYVDWYKTANNPTYSYTPVECPKELVDGFPTSFPVVDMSKY